MIDLVDVWKTFGTREVLRGLSFVVPRGKTYVLMGRSGSGKSVTLKHVIGILKPDRGSVKVDGMEVGELQPKQLAALRTRMGYLFQSGALINWLTVEQNVALPLEEHGPRGEKKRLSLSEVKERVMRVLRLVELERDCEKFPEKISGGMKLRVGLARALITEPEIVLYDEPNAGLDPIMSNQIHRLIVAVREQLGVTGLVVTHSRSCARAVGDRIGLLENGRIVEEGTVEEMSRSHSELVKEFLGGAATHGGAD